MKQALLLIDIQNDYFDGGANPLVGSYDASLKAKNALEEFRAKALPVIHIQHLSVRAGSTFFIPDTFGAEIHRNVKPINGEKVVTKNFPNSFKETELLDYLQTNGITDLVVCGMMTHMCVDATVRAAKDYGFNCTLIGEGCATKDLEINGKSVRAEDVQTAILASLNYFYAKVTGGIVKNQEVLHFLSDSNVWHSISEFTDINGSVSTGTGLSTVEVFADKITNRSYVELAGNAISNDYEIQIVSTTEYHFHSINPALGIQKGTFHVKGAKLFSDFVITNTLMHGFEVIYREGDVCVSDGALYDGNKLVNTWTSILKKQ